MSEFSPISMGLIFVHVSGLIHPLQSEDTEAALALGRKQTLYTVSLKQWQCAGDFKVDWWFIIFHFSAKMFISSAFLEFPEF